MRVALYHPWLKEKGGAEKVVLEAARRSEHDIKIYTLYYDSEKTFEAFEDVDIEILGTNKNPRGFIDKGLRFGVGALVKKIPVDEHDVLLVSEAGLGSLITLRNHDIPVMCYCHTPLRAALPEFKETYKQEKSLAIRPVFSIGTSGYSFLEKRAWKYFSHVFANSRLTKERILSKGLISKDKVSVLNPGTDVENNRSESYDKYFLYPTRFRRYKRQELAINAFRQADLDGFKLVLAGSAQEEEYLEELREIAGEDIRFETDVSDERWRELYENCYSVLFCAEKEDWGIIPVEAASYGKPVISVNEGGPKESIIDGETGFLVEAVPEKFAERMDYLAENPGRVEKMGKKAREESKKYSWEKFVETLDTEVERHG